MCIAILQTKGNSISSEVLTRCFNGNRHGAGFAYIRDGKVVIDKGYMTLPNFLNHYKQLLERKQHEAGHMLIHCRIATMGKIHKDNCHPFPLKEGALIHNGSLWWDEDYYSGTEAEKSDTRIFAERLHNILTYEDITVDKSKLERVIGGDKMAMLFNNGKYVILNEDRGKWMNGSWFSHQGPITGVNTDDWSWRDAD